MEQRRRRWCAPGAARSRSATRPTPRCRRSCAGTRPASPTASPQERQEARLPPACRLATVTGEPGAVDDALTLLAPPDAASRCSVPCRPATSEERLVLRTPRARGAELSRALGELQRVRSSRKLDAVRVQVDPVSL